MSIIAAFLLDLIVGDPAVMVSVHPVVLFGRLISALEKAIYPVVSSPRLRQITGCLLVSIVCATAYGATHVLLGLLGPIRGLLSLWLLSTAVATKGLQQAGLKVYNALKAKDLSQARLRVAEIVGRDTDNLSDTEVIRAAIESVAENLVDGITAPLFYAFIGGAPLALTYKAINTMDSMLGHLDERYRYFGWAAARLDDIANYVPARLTGICLVVSSALLQLDWQSSLKTILRDAGKHKSPNAGITEAGTAGAMGIQLGGVNYYDGEVSNAPLLGERQREMALGDILTVNRLILCSSILFLGAGFALTGYFRGYGLW